MSVSQWMLVIMSFLLESYRNTEQDEYAVWKNQYLSGNKLIHDIVLFPGCDQSTDAEDSDSNAAPTI